MPIAKGGRTKHPLKGKLVGEAQLDEAAPIIAAAIWLIKFAAARGAWPIIKWLIKRHGGKIGAGAAAAYYIDQGWDWVISQIGEEYAQMLIDNKFEIGMAVALILGAVALKKFIEKKGEALVAKYQEESMYETTTAGFIGATGNGFAAGGPGSMLRRGAAPKRRTKKKNR
jgi:hypothetical protein